jgi:putative transposase
VRERVARSRQLVARGRKVAVVARVMQISRQAIYRTPKPRTRPGPRPATGTVDRAIVEVARANPTDGTRMVAALAAREIGRPVSRKRAQRVMRAERLLQRHRPSGRRRRPGHFRVTRPDQLWHMDMTSIWVAEHGWCYLNAIVDCCTRAIAAWGLDLRCRRQEAEAVLEAGAEAHGIEPGQLTLGTDNGTAYTSRGFRARLKELEITHRRGGYRDPESQAFIESWFSKLKERLIWRSEFESLEDARAAIAAYVDSYHHRPHSGLGYRTPKEVRKTWEDARESETTTNSSGLR